jgi:hypothetical protein
MPGSKAIHFFAARHDLAAIFAAVESQRPLKYVYAWMSDTPDIAPLNSGLLIPNLGLAPSGDNNGDPFWLVTDVDRRVEIKSYPQRRGGVRYGIDPESNPDSVFLWPGGVFEGRLKWPGGAFEGCAVIAGQIGTGMINPKSLELMKIFTQAIHEQFKKVKCDYVGPEAKQLFDAGYRLTASVKSPKEYDLSID